MNTAKENVRVAMKTEIESTFDEAIGKVTEALKAEGFGVLTRIDLHQKVKEKIGKDLRPVVILGACNPQLAYEAYQRNTDVAALLPCNAVVREVGENRISIELARPSELMRLIGDDGLVEMSLDADLRLKRALEKISSGRP